MNQTTLCLLIKSNEILLALKKKGFGVGKWNGVGGKFDSKKEWDQDVHLYLVNEWEGDPKESDEVRPKWFNKNNLPFDKMWDDDKIWLPRILEGKRLRGVFTFDEGGAKIENYKLEDL